MKQFRALIFLGIVLVTLLVVIDTIDAGKREAKKREIETKYESGIGNSKNVKNGKLKKSENGRTEKLKKSSEYKTSNSENQFQEDKLETNKYNGKKGKNGGSKDGTNIKNNVNPKITKTYQKVKKYKVVEDVPAKKHSSSKKTPKQNKPQQSYKQEIVDDVFKSLKSTTPRKSLNEKIEDVMNKERNKLNGKEAIIIEEGNSGINQKKKKFKLVEVLLEEGGEEGQEGNESYVEVGIDDEDELSGFQRTESEEVIEKYMTTQTLKLPNTKKGSIHNQNSYDEDAEDELTNEDYLSVNQEEPMLNDEMFSDESSYASRYEDTHDPNAFQRCIPLPDDPNRKGPKKLTLYVIEEEVDGQIKKRVVSEEDGVTMCEVADLLQEYYYGGLE